MGHAIELKSNDGFAFDAYVAQPKKTPRAAIVLLQEIFGVNAHIRAVADGFALAGFFGDRTGHVFTFAKTCESGLQRG